MENRQLHTFRQPVSWRRQGWRFEKGERRFFARSFGGYSPVSLVEEMHAQSKEKEARKWEKLSRERSDHAPADRMREAPSMWPRMEKYHVRLTLSSWREDCANPMPGLRGGMKDAACAEKEREGDMCQGEWAHEATLIQGAKKSVAFTRCGGRKRSWDEAETTNYFCKISTKSKTNQQFLAPKTRPELIFWW